MLQKEEELEKKSTRGEVPFSQTQFDYSNMSKLSLFIRQLQQIFLEYSISSVWWCKRNWCLSSLNNNNEKIAWWSIHQKWIVFRLWNVKLSSHLLNFKRHRFNISPGFHWIAIPPKCSNRSETFISNSTWLQIWNKPKFKIWPSYLVLAKLLKNPTLYKISKK